MTELDLINKKELEIEEAKPFDKVIPRQHKWNNAMDFTEEQLVKRSNDLKQLEKLYPNVPYNWLEMAWNFCEKTPEEEQRNIIDNKLWEGKDAKKRVLGGIVKNAISISDPSGEIAPHAIKNES